MRYAVSSDERAALPDAVIAHLLEEGHEVIRFGAYADDGRADWPLGSADAARAVAAGVADQGVVICWTGTGASIAANKVPGVRCALCGDAPTAAGARRYNDANVLALSLRATTPALATEILTAWSDTAPADDAWNRTQLDRIAATDR